MNPTPVFSSSNSLTAGNLARRFAFALFEGRLPYRVSQWRDRLCRAFGWKHKAVRIGEMSFLVRRGTWADESILNHVVRDREYQPHGYEIGETDVVIDIGGNIGAFAVTAAQAARGGRVYAFEPEPMNFELLTRNLQRNGCRTAMPVNAAVSARAGASSLSVNPANSGSHSLVREHDGPSVTVQTVTLQSVFDRHRLDRCDFLKMDCEGAEYEILYSLPRHYFGRIHRIVLEYHGEPDTKRDLADNLVRYLQSVGYRIDIYTDIIGARGGLIYATRNNFRSSIPPRPELSARPESAPDQLTLLHPPAPHTAHEPCQSRHGLKTR